MGILGRGNHRGRAFHTTKMTGLHHTLALSLAGTLLISLSVCPDKSNFCSLSVSFLHTFQFYPQGTSANMCTPGLDQVSGCAAGTGNTAARSSSVYWPLIRPAPRDHVVVSCVSALPCADLAYLS